MPPERHKSNPTDDLANPSTKPEPVAEINVSDGTDSDDDPTWNAEDGDAFDGTGFWNERSTCASDKLRSLKSPSTKRTPRPSGTRGFEDIWGDNFDGMTPDMTLKEPGNTRRRLLAMLADATSTPPPNETVEGYDLLELLGEGGLGVVYQAIQKSINRKIAVKMIRPGIDEDPKEIDKFLSEAMVTGELDHPNIVPIHDLGTTTDGKPFYVMKLVKGTPWEDSIHDNTLTENLRILLDVCDAVSFAHSKGVIHRDLKPQNVMLGEFGEVQLMDWGLGASVTGQGNTDAITQSRAAGGTPAYMAPEMVTGENGPVGFHSDIYLLGAILYQIVTGKPPHAGKRVLDCLENAVNNVIRPTEHSGVLIDIARQAMQTDPADRYASVKDFKQVLVDYQANAESINLSQRSANDLRRACDERDYELFAQALFGFREALKLWEDNTDARAGVTETQLQFARCAYEKGDLDLAASTLDSDCSTHQSLAVDIEHARRRRAGARRRLKLLRAAALSLTAAVIIILTVAYLWISAARRQAVAAKETAVIAKEAETEQRKLAETAMAKARREEALATQALADLERAVQAMVAAQTQEERALAKARAADLVAAQTRDELAKTGMLLDNSWWVFDADAAKRKQTAAANALGLPVELTLALPDNVKLELVLIPPGDFVMGSPPKEDKRAADEYLHRVSHTRAYYLGKFELTEAQWRALTGEAPGSAAGRDADPALPVVGVSLERVMDELLPALQQYAPAGYEFRLPSEAEWEYACRAGTGTAYHTGDGQEALDAAGWFLSNSNRKVQPIGGKSPNAFGLYDLHGNVGEVCVDQYAAGYYLESPTNDPIADGDGEQLVVRGGSILNTPDHCRCAYRSYVYSKNQYEFLGLRLALVPCQP